MKNFSKNLYNIMQAYGRLSEKPQGKNFTKKLRLESLQHHCWKKKLFLFHKVFNIKEPVYIFNENINENKIEL